MGPDLQGPDDHRRRDRPARSPRDRPRDDRQEHPSRACAGRAHRRSSKSVHPERKPDGAWLGTREDHERAWERRCLIIAISTTRPRAMLSQTTSAPRMRSRASMLRSCAWTPSHRSPALRWMSCAIPATPQRDASLRGCRSSSGRRPTRRARRSHKVTGSWQHSRNTWRPDETTKSLAIMTTHALVQRVLVARSDLRGAHERAALDGCDARTNLMTPTTPPIHPLPSAAPTAPGSAISTTTPRTTTTEGASTPTNHAAHPVDHPPTQASAPSRAQHGPHLARPPNPGDDTTRTTTTLTTTSNKPTTAIPGAARTAPGPTTQSTTSQPPKGNPTTTSKKNKNRIQPMETHGEM